MKIKFKHNKKSILKAIGSKKNVGDLNKGLTLIAKKFVSDDSLGQQSHLAELIHKKLSYPEILFLASEEVKSRITAQMKEVEIPFEELLQKMFSDNKPTDESAKDQSLN